MSPSRRRRAVLMLQDRLGISERRACRYVGQHRSTQRHEAIIRARKPGSCCEPQIKASYCEPEAKADCCDPARHAAGTCGCNT